MPFGRLSLGLGLGNGRPAPSGGGGGTAPTNTVLPAITGTPTSGQTLSVSDGTWTGDAPIVYAYQWKADGTTISGATISTYTLTDTEIGKVITCTVTATNAAGSASATSDATDDVAPAAPVFINLSSAITATSGTSMQLSLPPSVVAGNILIAVTTVVSTRLPQWPSGWTPIGAAFAAYRIADGSESAGPTVTWTGSAGQAGYVAQFTAGTVGARNDNQGQNGPTASVSAITTTKSGSRCEAFVISGTSTIPSAPTGFTSDASDSNSIPVQTAIRVTGVTKDNPGDSSGSVSSTVASGIWRAALVELKAN
jgi:hypothetical protein